MDDFEYSVQVSEKDWDSFFRECEECNLLPPVLAGMEDSGMSDMDEIVKRKGWMNPESRVPDPELLTHSPDEEESPMDLYLSRYGMSSPLQVLSGSEEDTHMETVNMFFERLKGVSASEDSLRQNYSSNVEKEMAGHLKGFAEMPVDRCPEKNISMQKESSYTHGYAKSTVGTHIFTCPGPDKMFIKEKDGSPDVCKDISLKSSLGCMALCSALANGKDLICPKLEEAKKEAKSQPVVISDSDSKDLLVCQGQSSSITPRRKRKKKKRMGIESVEPDHGRVVQFQYRQSESDDDILVRRKELDREVCPSGDCSSEPRIESTLKSPDACQVEHILTLPDSQYGKCGAAFQTKTSAPDTIYCDIFPEINHLINENLSESQKNAEKKHNVTCFSHEELPKGHGQGILSRICNATLTGQSDPLNVNKAKIIPKACLNNENENDIQIKATKSTSEDKVKNTGTKDGKTSISKFTVDVGSKINTSDFEEDCEVHYIPPHHPSKDLESLLSSAKKGMASCIVESIGRADQTSLSITTTGDEIKCKMPHLHFDCPYKVPQVPLNAVMKSTLSPISINGAEQTSLNLIANANEEKVHHLSPLKNPERLASAVMESTTSTTPESVSRVEQTSLHVITTDLEGKVPNMHHVPRHFLSKDPEVSLSPAIKEAVSLITESTGGAEQNSLNVVASGEEEKGKVPYVSYHCPPKDVEVSLSSGTKVIASPIPEVNGGAEQTLLNFITNSDEEKYYVPHVPPYCTFKVPEETFIPVIKGAASPIPVSNGGAKQSSLNAVTSVDEAKCKVPPHSPSKYPKLALSPATEATASPLHESISGEEQTSLNLIATDDEAKDKVPHVPPHCPSKDPKLSLSPLTKATTPSSHESISQAEQTSLNVNVTGDEAKGKVNNLPLNCPSKYTEVSLRPAMKRMASPIPESLGEAGQTSLNDITNCPVEDLELSPNPKIECTTPTNLESLGKSEHLSSNISTTVGGTCKVCQISHPCPSKDCELPLGAVIPGMQCFSPEQVGEAQTLETLDNIRLSLNSQAEDCEEQTFSSPMSKDRASLPESGNGKNRSKLEILSPASQDMNKDLSLKEKTRSCQPFIQVTGPEGKLEDFEGAICCPGDNEKVKFVTPFFPSSDHELVPSALVQGSEPLPLAIDRNEYIPSSVAKTLKLPTVQLLPGEIMEDTPSPTPSPAFESVDEVKGFETDSVKSQSPNPVYAISSFWNEMEKLTINDILRLRLVGQAQHPSVLLQPEDSGIADISDAADSGYFTYLDDSKPDRSSGDMSFISDFDEELAQLQMQEAARLDEGSRDSPNSRNSMWENDLDPAGTGTGMEEMLSSETAISSPFYRDSAQQCLRKMRKNISVQNLQTLEAKPLRKILRNASLISFHSVHSTHSIHSEGEEDYVDPFDRVEASSPVYLSDEEEEMESITFSEIIQYLFGGDESERSASPVDNIAASYLDGSGTSVSENYDHFFSEFEAGSIFNPLADDNSYNSNTELVPIFSCTRSANKNLQFPEVYDYFFVDDSPVHSDEDEEFDYTSIQVITRHDHMAAESHNVDIPAQENSSWNFLRNNPLSFRRIRRTGFTAPPEESSTWALSPVKNNGRSFHRGIQPINVMGPDERPFQDPLLLSLENHIFRQLANQQKIQQEMQTTVVDPRMDAPLMPLKQADMCLVCIAFASWVLKSANPQGADMWKAALLANISALSAIRYLRRYMRDEATKKTPLRQIEPACTPT